jgi:hypothetical protein
MQMLRFLTPVLAAAAATLCIGTGAAQAATARPDAGNGFTVSLAASSTDPYVGTPVTLTATANTDVGPTPYYITIYDETTGAELAVCGSGITCSATVSESSTGSQQFGAFIGDDVPGTGQPGFVLVSSNQVSVLWWRFIIIGQLSPLAR